MNNHVERQWFGQGLPRAVAFFFILFAALMFPQRSYSQTFDPLISFSVESCGLDVALEKLFAEYELNVAFSKAELSKIRIERYSCSYKPVEEVLSDLLQGTGYGFKRIGKQYVIRKNQLLDPEEIVDAQEPVVQPPKETVVQKTDTVRNKVGDTIRIFDTVQIIRSVMRYDTIVSVKEVVRHDTVYAVKYKGLEIHWPKFRENGWFVAPSFSYNLTRLDYENPEPDANAVGIAPVYSFALGLDGGYKYERLGVGLNVSYRSMSYRFMLDRTVHTGDYYINDTLDTYYVVQPYTGDTTYHYILDSTYVPLVTTNYSYRDINRLDYLTVGLFASFDFLRNEYFRMFVKAGLSADFLLGASGSCSEAEQPFFATLTREHAEPFRLSYYGGLGLGLKVSDRVELVPEVLYRGSSSAVYRKDCMMGMKMRNWDFRLGLTYYF